MAGEKNWGVEDDVKFLREEVAVALVGSAPASKRALLLELLRRSRTVGLSKESLAEKIYLGSSPPHISAVTSLVTGLATHLHNFFEDPARGGGCTLRLVLITASVDGERGQSKKTYQLGFETNDPLEQSDAKPLKPQTIWQIANEYRAAQAAKETRRALRRTILDVGGRRASRLTEGIESAAADYRNLLENIQIKRRLAEGGLGDYYCLLCASPQLFLQWLEPLKRATDRGAELHIRYHVFPAALPPRQSGLPGVVDRDEDDTFDMLDRKKGRRGSADGLDASERFQEEAISAQAAARTFEAALDLGATSTRGSIAPIVSKYGYDVFINDRLDGGAWGIVVFHVDGSSTVKPALALYWPSELFEAYVAVVQRACKESAPDFNVV